MNMNGMRVLEMALQQVVYHDGEPGDFDTGYRYDEGDGYFICIVTDGVTGRQVLFGESRQNFETAALYVVAQMHDAWADENDYNFTERTKV